MLHKPVTKLALAKGRQDILSSLYASHIRVIPDVRFDCTGHIIAKQKEQNDAVIVASRF
jgi:hypothetical protein